MENRAMVAVERTVERAGDAVWHRLRRRPFVGVTLASAAGLTLASVVGVAELGFAFLVGYGAYKILRQNEPPSRAFKEVAAIEKELGV